MVFYIGIEELCPIDVYFLKIYDKNTKRAGDSRGLSQWRLCGFRLSGGWMMYVALLKSENRIVDLQEGKISKWI
jgi:hypothetical protein